MAKQETITVECPNCGEECRVKPAPAIKHDDEKTLKKLFEGTLNKFTCKACGIPFALTRPLVYKDWNRYLSPTTSIWRQCRLTDIRTGNRRYGDRCLPGGEPASPNS